MRSRGLSGITALVTGAAGGIGSGFVQALLDAGAAHVYAASRDGKGVQDSERVSTLGFDVTDPTAITEAVAHIDRLDLLVDSAGAATRLDLATGDIDDRPPGSRRGVARKRTARGSHQVCPPRQHSWETGQGGSGQMFVIGIDPHKGSHTAAALDGDEELVGELRVEAGPRQHDELLGFAARFAPRTWAIESASGWGALLAQQLVAAGETVVDVPPALSARARLLDGRDKTDGHDARSAAVVALRHRRLRAVTEADHRAVLRLWADRHRDLVAARTRVVCRLHALLCLLIPGGKRGRLDERSARAALDGLRGLGWSRWNVKPSPWIWWRIFSDWTTSSLGSSSASPPPLKPPARRSPTSTVSARSWQRSSSATPATSPGSRPLGTTPATTPPLPSKPPPDPGSGTGSTPAATGS